MYSIPSGSRECFYVWNDQAGKKINFYFAIEEGGDFDIDFDVHTPSKRAIMKEHHHKVGDYILTGNEVGEYSFCFQNGQSSSGDKMILFDLNVENEVRNNDVSRLKKETEMQSSIFRLGGELQHIHRVQRYLRLRENRHFATLISTEKRVWWFALLESFLVGVVAVIQVCGIQALFTAKKSRR
ncbi:hypothetical protein H4219_006053 [Mycoemilia scoparia]|uniref:GOLD domain-containing protein n=1 Tax=Mycoemilia scoparia TaxID=417184 RepID=A0A9W7ZK45_9FUNG|nr:hypothetical protein H4219_006053 [Mycoemilia scoparia]